MEVLHFKRGNAVELRNGNLLGTAIVMYDIDMTSGQTYFLQSVLNTLNVV